MKYRNYYNYNNNIGKLFIFFPNNCLTGAHYNTSIFIVGVNFGFHMQDKLTCIKLNKKWSKVIRFEYQINHFVKKRKVEILKSFIKNTYHIGV